MFGEWASGEWHVAMWGWGQDSPQWERMLQWRLQGCMDSFKVDQGKGEHMGEWSLKHRRFGLIKVFF